MIEYRVWDVENSKMIYRPVSSSDEIFISPTGQIWKVNQTNHSAVLNMISPEKFIILQFTGIKDKNGKEIYEGDIMEFIGSYFKKQIDVIVFEDGVFDFQKGEVMWEEHPSYIRQGEVIGNIYENPELLKQN